MLDLDLDNKVYGRDSVFVASDSHQLDGWLSKLNRKRKKISRKFSIGTKIARKMPSYKHFKKFESKNRKTLKKIGAVAAIAVGAWFAGPAILKFVGTMGGKGLATSAAKKLAGVAIGQAINKKMGKKQQAAMKQRFEGMTEAQILTDPELVRLTQEIAEAEAASIAPTNVPAEKKAAKVMGAEGAIEIESQVAKVATPTSMQQILKFGIPISFGLLTLLL